MTQHTEALVKQMLDAVKGYYARASAGIMARLDEIEARLKALPAAMPDLHALVREESAPLLEELVGKAIAALPKPADGKSVGMDEVVPLVEELVGKAIAALPKPADGKSVGMDEIAPLVEELVGKEIAALPKPADGKSVHPDTVALMVRDQVERTVATIRLPEARNGEDGRDALQLDPLPSIDESKSYPRGTWASHNGGLMRAARMTDPVSDGLIKAGWVVMVEGIAGIDIAQGDDLRTLSVSATLTGGTKATADFRLPVLIYRGIWREGEYESGDVCTWGGSAWHSQIDNNTDKPGMSSSWKLMVKEGARGKDAQISDAQPPRPVRIR